MGRWCQNYMSFLILNLLTHCTAFSNISPPSPTYSSTSQVVVSVEFIIEIGFIVNVITVVILVVLFVFQTQVSRVSNLSPSQSALIPPYLSKSLFVTVHPTYFTTSLIGKKLIRDVPHSSGKVNQCCDAEINIRRLYQDNVGVIIQIIYQIQIKMNKTNIKIACSLLS